LDLFSGIFLGLFQNKWFDPVIPEQQITDKSSRLKALNAAFLIVLAGKKHPGYAKALKLLTNEINRDKIGIFYKSALDAIQKEIEHLLKEVPDFRESFQQLEQWCAENNILKDRDATQELLWSLFFPEGTNIRGNEQDRIEQLRNKRQIQIDKTNKSKPINPANNLLFTSNILLTIPLKSLANSNSQNSDDFSQELEQIRLEQQKFWYDHPIPIGIAPEKNEFLYGLQGLDEAIEFEKNQGNLDAHKKLTCILSASVTHNGLHQLARKYLQHELQKNGGLKHLEIYIFTEADCANIVNEILLPATQSLSEQNIGLNLFEMFGVDGEYGRHYSFLKAICAYWHVFINPDIKATFKIDLDQVFPQQELVTESGSSVFEHFKSDLWGANGSDQEGIKYDMGMIAGALVNQGDISKSLFTPDVPFPKSIPKADETIFYSKLPQALSTEAEMMTRYQADSPVDGSNSCIQRVHVTGGTNGIRVESLFKYTPFTPSFIGRAEDQAYIMSTFNHPQQLAYTHKDGFFMRHDKQSFAQEAMQAASIGKLIGDYTRIILFSYYARVVDKDYKSVKSRLDPFTGCFISQSPVTVVMLRFALKAASFFADDQPDQAENLIMQGSHRLSDSFDMVSGSPSLIEQRYRREKKGWEMYYWVLQEIKTALERRDAAALAFQQTAKTIVDRCRISDK
jgi:hypothetical protein